MKIHRQTFILISSLLLVLAAGCGGPSGPTGDPVRGQELFNQNNLGQGPGCTTCHLIEPDKVKIGPSLSGVAARAQTRVADLTAEEYLRQSILEPNAYGVLGFPYNVMYQDFAEQLTDQDLADIVAYLLTLE